MLLKRLSRTALSRRFYSEIRRTPFHQGVKNEANAFYDSMSGFSLPDFLTPSGDMYPIVVTLSWRVIF